MMHLSWGVFVYGTYALVGMVLSGYAAWALGLRDKALTQLNDEGFLE